MRTNTALTACVVVLVAMVSAVVNGGDTDELVIADFERRGAKDWRGGSISDDQAVQGTRSLKWENLPRHGRLLCASPPRDWTAHEVLSFALYAHKANKQGLQLVISSENPETDGIDYYSMRITVNWTGWKTFNIRLKALAPVREPRGWDQIDRVYFSAGGWGHTPLEDSLMYLDDVKLKKSIRTSDAELFALLDLDYPGMEKVARACKRKDYKQAAAAYLEFRRAASKARWNIDPADRPAKASSRTDQRADTVLEHKIGGAFVGEDIDWQFNPRKRSDPAFTTEWTWQNLNRMPAWNTLGRAYWRTLDEKYAKEWVEQVVDWVEDNPVPFGAGAGSTLTWRTIEAGIRMSGSWMNAYCYFLHSPSFTPQAHCTFIKGIIEHGWRLREITLSRPGRTGNWITMECNGLGTLGILFPELKEAGEFRTVAFERMYKELDTQVYPDGAQIELSTGYHQVSRGNFIRLAKVAQMNDVALPEGYLERLKKMYVFNLYMMDPTGYLPPLNDSWSTNVKSSLQEAYDTWQDEEFLFGATLGKKGKRPPHDSYMFPYAGYCVMRTGWDHLDTYLLFDAGPIGAGHHHEDKLTLFLYSKGRMLVTEAGGYGYDQSKWRRYALLTPGHSTIAVDGKHQYRGDNRKPVTEPSAVSWATSTFFDYAAGTFDAGYRENRYKQRQYYPMEWVGEKDRSVTHTRHIVFLKPFYFLVIDFLEGSGEHTYDAYFHLDAEDAELEERTKAVHSVRRGSVQLGLFPMDVQSMQVRIAKGQQDPILGWILKSKRAIPTVVLTRKGRPPVTFSSLLYPYVHDRPEIQYADLMPRRKNLWAKRITTPFEQAAVFVARSDKPARTRLEPEIAPPFVTDAKLTVVRQPKDEEQHYLGFYNVSQYEAEHAAFSLESPASILTTQQQGTTLIYNAQDKALTAVFRKPPVGTVRIPPRTWMRITADGAEPVREDITPWPAKAALDLFPNLPSYRTYAAGLAAAARHLTVRPVVLQAENMIAGDTDIKVSSSKKGAARCIYMWDNEGQKIEHEFTVRERGRYRVLVKYCAPGDPCRSFSLDGNIPFKEAGLITFPSTQGDPPSDGWSNNTDDWQRVVLGERTAAGGFLFHLDRGRHTLTLTNEGKGGMNVDYVAVFPCDMSKREVIATAEKE